MFCRVKSILHVIKNFLCILSYYDHGLIFSLLKFVGRLALIIINF